MLVVALLCLVAAMLLTCSGAIDNQAGRSAREACASMSVLPLGAALRAALWLILRR